MAASNVQFLLTNPAFGIVQTVNATVTVQAENISLSGPVTLLPLRIQQITDGTGQTTFTNIYGSSISGFYHWTVAVSNSSQRVQGDMWVQNTNLGAVAESSIDIVNGAPSYPAGTWCWSAQAADIRYQLNNAQGTNNFYPLFGNPSNYVQQALLTIQINNVTNPYTSIVLSNPSAFITPAQLNTATNGGSTTNWVGANFVLQTSLTTSNFSTVFAANSNLNSASNVLQFAKQPASTILTNLAGLSNTNQIVYTNDKAWFDVAGAAGAASNSLQFAKQPASTILTNLAGLSNTNQIVYTNDTTWFDTAGKAQQATNGLGGMAFQGTNGWIRTNGATATGQVPAYTNSGSGFVWVTATGSGAATNAWNLGGNANLGSFIGTTTTNPFVMVANNQPGITVYSPQPYDMRITMGLSNTISADSASTSNRNSAILSGIFNTIIGGAPPDPFDGHGLIIIGGIGNTNAGTGLSLIGDGIGNLLSSHPFETILNGSSNHVASVNYGQIINGQQNSVLNSFGGWETILNGFTNSLSGIYGTIINGQSNVVASGYSTILGGIGNQTTGSPAHQIILGGVGNISGAEYDIIGNGVNQTNNDQWCTVLNGNGNSLQGGLSFLYSDIYNGIQNSIVISAGSSFCDIFNGQNNSFNVVSGANHSLYDQIFDGNGNLMLGTGPFWSLGWTFIANGNGNTIRRDSATLGDFSFILDGQTNAVASSLSSYILDGGFDTISNSAYSSILSGTNSLINLATNAVIIGQNVTVTNNNSFVISDGNPISSLTNNQLILSFTNGVDIRTNLTINGKAAGSIWGSVTNLTVAYRSASAYYFVTNSKPYYGIITTN